MSKVTEAKTRIKEILEARATEVAKRESELQTARAELAAAASALEEATRDGDPVMYRKAKQAKSEKADVVELYEVRIDQLKKDGSALISDDEYCSLKDGIIEELSAICSKERKTVCDMLAKMETIKNELIQKLNEGNAVLKDLQSDVYRNKDRTKTKTGYILSSDELSFKDYSLSIFLADVIERAKMADIIAK